MDERQNKASPKEGIELEKAVALLFRKMWLILLVAVLCAVLTYAGTYFLITPQYEASAVFYVNNSDLSIGDASISIDSGDISASKSLVNTYIVILKDRVTLEDIVEYADVNMSSGALAERMTAEALSNTEVFKVTVKDPSPQNAEKLANAVAHVLPIRISDIIDGSSVKIVSDAIIPAKPCSPNYTVNTLVGFLIGFVLMVGIILVREIFDVRIRAVDDIMEVCDGPILASVPDMASGNRSGYGYAYESSGAKAKKHSSSEKPVVIGNRIGFTASEAYKLLRTKLQFSFSDDSSCRVIGVSSSVSGEGKSLTSINLVNTLAQLNKRVILVDCDMRRPTVAEKLEIKKKPGLSSYLTGQSKLTDLLQTHSFSESGNAFHVITAGQTPPNPVELLSSERMKKMLGVMRSAYDYVILDLPPVAEVSDALAVAKETDGMLLVVRQNVCDRNILTDTLRQFDFIDAKVLGIVFNSVIETDSKRYYKKYYKGRYRKYYSHYSHYSRRSSENTDTVEDVHPETDV